MTVIIFYIINLVLNLVVTALLFAIIFKVLPDAKIRWKDIWPGAITTSILFLIGKFAISLYISKSNVGSTFGAAGSLVILLVWVYYSAIILYFGAEFSKAYILESGARIVPDEYAQWNNVNTIAGGKSQDNKQETAQPEESFQNRATPIAFANEPIMPKRKKKPSTIVAVVIALLLYLFKSKRANVSSKV